MILDEQVPEIAAYRAAEHELSVEARNEWAHLVVFGGNQDLPVHDWFRFKEGFSAALLGSIVDEVAERLPRQDLVVLDPFCGVGTTLLSAQALYPRIGSVVGIECNPFIRFVARTKLRWSEMNPVSLVADGLRSIAKSADLQPRLPSLSSIRQGRCISVHVARRLAAIAEAANRVGENRDFVKLGLAASVEALSRIRRDGRALRIIPKPIRPIQPTLRRAWAAMAEGVMSLRSSQGGSQAKCLVVLGDGRDPGACGIAEGSVDLILTSPPYPNNIDYTEVYKLELWLLGFVSSAAEFLALRRATFRSHPTYDKTGGVPADFEDELRRGSLRRLLGGLVTRLENSPDAWRGRLLTAYFGDLWSSVRQFKKAMSSRGVAVFVVGNSLHGTDFPALVATDLVLAQIVACHGMTAHISAARGLKRRLSGNHFLRESVVIAKKG
jgi:hypothetical protein